MEKVLGCHRDIDKANEALAAYFGKRETDDPDDEQVGELLITEAVLAMIGFRLKSELQNEGRNG